MGRKTYLTLAPPSKYAVATKATTTNVSIIVVVSLPSASGVALLYETEFWHRDSADIVHPDSFFRPNRETRGLSEAASQPSRGMLVPPPPFYMPYSLGCGARCNSCLGSTGDVVCHKIHTERKLIASELTVGNGQQEKILAYTVMTLNI